MCLRFLRISLLTLVFYRIVASKNCDNSICNHEAVCILENQKPTCECVGKFYEDKFCSKPVDHCQPNPCENGGKCHPYPGHYYCECTADFTAQRCTSKQKAFKQFHLHYNRIAPIGKEQSLLLMVHSLGAVETLMELTTPDFIIDGVVFPSSKRELKKSSDLKALGKRLGIRHSDKLPYKQGFYRLSHATFWQLGLQTMTIDLSDFELTAENFYKNKFDIFVYDPNGVRCLPVLHLPYGSSHRKLMHIDILKFTFIEPIVEKRCAENSHLRIKWSVRNYIDTVVLHRFPEVPSVALPIPPNTMWFNYLDDYVQLYLIKGEVTEDIPGKSVRRTELRCYAIVDSKETTATILGGDYREVNVAKGFVIDGSYSRDFARRPHRDQRLKYAWSCSSEDTKNRHCLKNMGSASRIEIPSRALKLNQIYTFSLKVRSTINIYSTHKVSQQIKAVSKDPLLLQFHCLRNCDRNMFAAGKIIHLKVECVKCPSGDVTYSVRNAEEVEVATSYTVILTEDTKSEVSFKAEATLGSRKGMSSITLTLNKPPVGGSCEISPTSGDEFKTIFEISCLGYQDEEKPITYKYRAGNTTLDHTGNKTLSTRLFPTSGQSCEIEITVCDYLEACTEVKLQATVNPISTKGSWLGLLSEEDTNLKQLIANGDRCAAIVLIQAVIPHIPTGESLQIAEYIVKSLRDLELKRLLAVEQVLTLSSDLYEAVELSSDSAILVSELFAKVADGLMLAIRNEEINELQLDTYEQMIGELTQSMVKSTKEVEEFPMVHDAEVIPPEDPFMEDYPDYGELDMEPVVHISNWLYSFNRMHRCLQILGLVSAFVKLPDETATITKMNGITSRTLVLDTSKTVSLTWNESVTSVSLPNEFLKSINRKEIAIQVSIFEANPFWWNPDQHKVNTEVLSVGAYTKDLKSLNAGSTKVAFNFFMTIKGNADLQLGNVINGCVKDSLDMQIYERLLPANAVLVVTFSNVDKDLQILLTAGKKPRSYMFKEANIVTPSSANATFVLVNHNSEPSEAFLAIMSAGHAKFSFAMYTRLCLTWNPSTYEWTSEYCSIGSQTNATHIHCSCRHLSMFAAKVHSTFGHLKQPRSVIRDLPLNYGMIAFYMIIVIFLCLLLLLARWRDMVGATGLVVLNSKPRRRATHKYVVTIYTNGHAVASTTSNVMIQLHGSLSDSAQYTLYSKTSHLLFRRNCQTSFEILSATSFGALQSVSLHHDSFGRYPTWNCHMVKVRDDENRQEYIFSGNKWLSDIESTSCAILIPLVKKNDFYRRRRIFRDTLTDAFANWYAHQAICSRRLYGKLTATEKTAILIVRVCITLVGTIIVFGPTTMFTYEEERETYYSMLLDIGKIILIAFCCHLVGLVVAAALQYLFLKLRPSQGSVSYTALFAK